MRKGERTRERLFEAAEQVFGKRGYHDASLVEITETAGVGLGTFYGHFESKRAIFEELLRIRGEELREALRDRVAGIVGRAARDEAGVRAYLGWIGEHPGMYAVARQAATLDPEAMGGWYEGIARDYAAALAAAMRDGEIPQADPEILAYAMMGVADFLAMRFIVWKSGGPLPEETVAEAVRLVHRIAGFPTD